MNKFTFSLFLFSLVPLTGRNYKSVEENNFAMQSSFSRKQGGYYSLESRNVSLLCPLLHSICINKHTLHNYFSSFGPFLFFFNFSTIHFLASGQAKVTENWLLQAHGITYLQTLQSRVCYRSIFFFVAYQLHTCQCPDGNHSPFFQ